MRTLLLVMALFSTIGFGETRSYEDLQMFETYQVQFPTPHLPDYAHGAPRPNYRHHSTPVANSWAWKSIGLDAAPAIPISFPCGSTIVVAVVDTGADWQHNLLKTQMWVNEGEIGKICTENACIDKAADGIDNDGNGYVDDAMGWDFVHDINTPYDVHGHGTHVSSVINYISHEGLGSQPKCPDVLIMDLKYFSNDGLGYNNLQNTVRAFQYAIKMGADIINYSGGGSDPAYTERLAVKAAQKAGVLIIAAAGNEGQNNDLHPYYPASYGYDNIISVANHDENMKLVASSNYGLTVNVAAPGTTIRGALPEGQIGTMSGTSQACSVVSGVAAVLTKRIGHRDYKRVRAAILGGTLPLSGHPIMGHGRVYLPEAIRVLEAK